MSSTKSRLICLSLNVLRNIWQNTFESFLLKKCMYFLMIGKYIKIIMTSVIAVRQWLLWNQMTLKTQQITVIEILLPRITGPISQLSVILTWYGLMMHANVIIVVHRPSLVHVMAWCWTITKPSNEPILFYCQLYWRQTEILHKTSTEINYFILKFIFVFSEYGHGSLFYIIISMLNPT